MIDQTGQANRQISKEQSTTRKGVTSDGARQDPSGETRIGLARQCLVGNVFR